MKESTIQQIGLRLKQERERLGLTQADLARRALVSPNTQVKYEGATTYPDAVYLAKFAHLGADVLYIVTGRAGGVLAPDESALLAGYRAMDDRGRAMVLAMIGGYTHQAAPSLTISGATIGQVVQGDAAGGGQVVSSPEAGASKKRR